MVVVEPPMAKEVDVVGVTESCAAIPAFLAGGGCAVLLRIGVNRGGGCRFDDGGGLWRLDGCRERVGMDWWRARLCEGRQSAEVWKLCFREEWQLHTSGNSFLMDESTTLRSGWRPAVCTRVDSKSEASPVPLRVSQ